MSCQWTLWNELWENIWAFKKWLPTHKTILHRYGQQSAKICHSTNYSDHRGTVASHTYIREEFNLPPASFVSMFPVHYQSRQSCSVFKSGHICLVVILTYRFLCHLKWLLMKKSLKEWNELPIPDEPRKRNTRGCSSSYQPFSFLLMARENQDREIKIQRPLYHLFTLLYSKFHWTNLRVAGTLKLWWKREKRRDEKTVRDIWWKKDEEEREQSRRARWETSRKLPTMPLLPLSQWGH